MDLNANDVIGEDGLLYNRDSQYTAIVTSISASFFQIDHDKFKSAFAKLLSPIKLIFDARFTFIEERCKIIRFLNEYKCLDLSTKQTVQTTNNWLIHKQHLYRDENSDIVDKKFWPMFQRK